MRTQEQFMLEALKEADKAEKENEVPIGAVIVKNGEIIARGHNRRETKQNALLHAEIIAIDKACKKLKSWRLDGCDIYVSLEPCPMCAGAILNARIGKLFFGASDLENGFAGGKMNIFSSSLCNHNCFVNGGLLASKCKEKIQNFFKAKRKH